MAEWGVDAFKVDGCNANVSHMKQTYPALGAALNSSQLDSNGSVSPCAGSRVPGGAGGGRKKR